MYIKLNKNNNKSIAISIYNNATLIYEVRHLHKIKFPALIEYFDISKFIYEDSLMINEVNYTEVSYQYLCCEKDSHSNLESCSNCLNLIPNSIVIKADNIKKNLLELYYLTKNIVWSSSYNIILEKDSLSIESWFNITNNSGLDIEKASINLITGNVKLPYIEPILYNEGSKYLKTSDLSANVENISDYSIYVLKESYNLLNNTMKRIFNFKKCNITTIKLTSLAIT